MINDYNVIFEYTGGKAVGCRTWYSFKNEEEFKKYSSEDMQREKKKVIAENVTINQAIQICEEHGLASLLVFTEKFLRWKLNLKTH
mgnify:FL=1